MHMQSPGQAEYQGMKSEFEQQDIQKIADMVIERLRPLILAIPRQSNESIMDVNELSSYLKVNNSWIYDQVKNSAIPYIKTGKFLRFKKSSIDKWIETQTVKPF